MSGEQHYASLQDYLNKSGVLERGDTEEIAQAKKEYRRYYMRQYKREKRGNKEKIVLSIPKNFHKKLNTSARKHGVSIPRFLLEIVRAHINSAPVIHHPDKFAELEIEIARLHSELVFIGDKMMQTGHFTTHSKDRTHRKYRYKCLSMHVFKRLFNSIHSRKSS